MWIIRQVLNGKEIVNWAKDAGFPTTIPFKDLYVTIAYPGELTGSPKLKTDLIEIDESVVRQVSEYDYGAIVISFDHPKIQERRDEFEKAQLFKNAGGSGIGYGKFSPHVTFTYNPTKFDWTELEAYKGRIILGPETIGQYDPNYLDNLIEE